MIRLLRRGSEETTLLPQRATTYAMLPQAHKGTRHSLPLQHPLLFPRPISPRSRPCYYEPALEPPNHLTPERCTAVNSQARSCENDISIASNLHLSCFFVVQLRLAVSRQLRQWSSRASFVAARVAIFLLHSGQYHICHLNRVSINRSAQKAINEEMYCCDLAPSTSFRAQRLTPP